MTKAEMKDDRYLEHDLLMAVANAARIGNPAIKDILAKIEERDHPNPDAKHDDKK